MITAETITDEQIRELRAESLNDMAAVRPKFDQQECADAIAATSLALQIAPRLTDAQYQIARARCAEIWNARNAKAVR